ncbi:MAG: FHA domain-containing protein [Deltaproteobacteria bacterium]|nr:FHA domain-containing protein [Deltaproteobacteria bacterium]
MLLLTVFKDGRRIMERKLPPGEYVLGRQSDCDIILEDRQVSRRHARMTAFEDRATIEDLGSVNRLIQEGKESGSATLDPGHPVIIRPFTLTVEAQIKTERVEADKTIILGSRETAGIDPPTVILKPNAPSNDPQPLIGSPFSKLGPLGEKRTLLYTLAGLAAVAVGMMLVFGAGDGSDGSPSKTVDMTRPTQEKELSQVERMAAINLVKGKQALESGRLEEAADLLHRAAVAAPGNEEIANLLAQVQDLLETKRNERERLQREQAVMAEETGRLMSLAAAAINDQNFDQAEALALEVLELDPSHQQAQDLARFAAESRQEAAETLQTMERSLSEALSRGRELKADGKPVEAVSVWEEARLLDPGLRSELTEKIQELIDGTRAEQRKLALPRVDKAKNLLKSDPRQAFKELREVLTTDPWNTEAGELMEKVLARLNSEAKKLFDQGLVLESLGERRKACAKWAEALKSAPEDGELHRQIEAKGSMCD